VEPTTKVIVPSIFHALVAPPALDSNNKQYAGAAFSTSQVVDSDAEVDTGDCLAADQSTH